MVNRGPRINSQTFTAGNTLVLKHKNLRWLLTRMKRKRNCLVCLLLSPLYNIEFKNIFLIFVHLEMEKS